MILQQCTVSGNTATNDGGGLRNNQTGGIATSMKEVNRCEAHRHGRGIRSVVPQGRAAGDGRRSGGRVGGGQAAGQGQPARPPPAPEQPEPVRGEIPRSILDVTGAEIDAWLRSLEISAVNLRAWIEPLPRTGKVIRTVLLHREVTALARALKLEWPRNVLRHSFISYRIATVKSADQVALEAGNSAAIIFKHYRELATEAEANEWFGILPKEGQWENTFDWDRRARIVTLPDNDGE